MKTREMIFHLKRDWALDPCWDLEDTEGFEDHREELLQYSNEMNEHWERVAQEKRQARLTEVGKIIGIEDNKILAQAFLSIFDRLDRLEGNF